LRVARQIYKAIGTGVEIRRRRSIFTVAKVIYKLKSTRIQRRPREISLPEKKKKEKKKEKKKKKKKKKKKLFRSKASKSSSINTDSRGAVSS